MLVPYESDNVGMYFPSFRTYVSAVVHGEGEIAFSDAVAAPAVGGPTSRIVLAPSASDHIGLFDYLPNTYSSGPSHGEGDNAFSGATLTSPDETVLESRSSIVIGLVRLKTVFQDRFEID